jgi:hypothetical protein
MLYHRGGCLSVRFFLVDPRFFYRVDMLRLVGCPLVALRTHSRVNTTLKVAPSLFLDLQGVNFETIVNTAACVFKGLPCFDFFK